MIEEKLSNKLKKSVKDSSVEEVYNALLELVSEMIEEVEHVDGSRKLYYISAEFLLGKLLVNNLMNLDIYDEVEKVLNKANKSISQLEDYEIEPSLGNGGLGRLAACFLDSIATLNLNGEGLGINYHYGLFKQIFENNRQKEKRDPWLNQKNWLRKTDYKTTIKIKEDLVDVIMYEIDILGYSKKKTTLKLFDLKKVNEDLVTKDIDFDQKALSENLTLFLYPDDSTEAGRKLRFAQQYFLVESSLNYILDHYDKPLEDLASNIVIQINDTHPSMAIVLLIKKLLENNITFAKAVEIVENTFAYTNHTILAEALEKWPLEFFKEINEDSVIILKLLNEIVKTRSSDEEVLIIDKDDKVHMASLAIHFSYSTNGVAALHTEILKNSELKPFYNLYSEKFNNKTNGITFRRWLLFSNKKLSNFIESLIGSEFKEDAIKLKDLRKYENDQSVLKRLLEIKQEKKLQLKEYLKEEENIEILDNGIYDIQIKRLHEYKRQQMNLLYIINKYLEIKEGKKPQRPLIFIFGSKAAPAYTIAKDIISSLLTLRDVIENDKDVNKHIQIVFVENYNVTKAEKLIPAADVSEQISLASKEASGTGNMKLMLNGALTLGTLDGANLEIANLVEKDNIYIFGKDADTIIDHYKNESYDSKKYYKRKDIKKLVDFITSKEMLKYGHKENLSRLQKEIISKDWFMTLIDLEDYIKVKNKVFKDYEDRLAWANKMLVNIAEAGFFSSDRTISDYNQEIWKLK